MEDHAAFYDTTGPAQNDPGLPRAAIDIPVTVVTSVATTTVYIGPIERAGYSGQSLEQAMTPVAHNYEAPAHIMLSAASIHAVTHAAKAAIPVAPREDMDLEERRWQLEWDRRNVED